MGLATGPMMTPEQDIQVRFLSGDAPPQLASGAPQGLPLEPQRDTSPLMTQEDIWDALQQLPLDVLSKVDRISRIDQTLRRSPYYAALDPAERSNRLMAIMTHMGYPPPSGGDVAMAIGKTAGRTAVEIGASMYGGPAGRPLVGLAARALAPTAAGVVTNEALEYARPMITGEPYRPWETRAKEEVISGGTSIVLDALTSGLIGMGADTVRATRGLHGRDARMIAERGMNVLDAAGTPPTLGRYFGTATSPTSPLEGALRNALISNRFFLRYDQQGKDAVTALFQELTDDMARATDPAQVAQGLTNMLRHRDHVGRSVTRAAFSTIEQAMGSTTIDLSALMSRIQRINAPEVRRVLGKMFGVSPDLEQADFLQRITQVAPTTTWDDVQRMMTEVSRARRSRNATLNRTAGALYHEIDAVVRQQVQHQLGTNAPHALAIWDAARAFTREHNQTMFSNVMVRSALDTLTREPSKLASVVLRNPDATRAIRQALEQPITQQVAGMAHRLHLPGYDYWTRVVQPKLLQAITEGALDQNGFVTNPRFIKRFLDDPVNARGLEAAFSRNEVTRLRELTDAMVLMSPQRITHMNTQGMESRMARQVQYTVLGGLLGYTIGGMTGHLPPLTPLQTATIAGTVTIPFAALGWLLTKPQLLRGLIRHWDPQTVDQARKLSSLIGRINGLLMREGVMNREDINTLLDAPARKYIPGRQPVREGEGY